MATYNLPTSIVKVTPTLDTNIFASGDQVGPGTTKLDNVCQERGQFVVLDSLIVTDASKSSAAIDLLFWDRLPTIVSVENAAFDVADADVALGLVGILKIAAADYAAFNANSAVSKTAIGLVMRPDLTLSGADGRDLWMSIVSRGTPTYAATSLKFTLTFLQR